MPDLIRRLIFEFAGATPEGPKNLALLNRLVNYRAIKGIEAIEQPKIPALFTLISTREEGANATYDYRAIVKSLEIPNKAYRLEIARSFIAKMEIYLQDSLKVAPAEFHDIMGREFILKREKNKPANEQITPGDSLAFNIDYAMHIARAFGLAQFIPGDNQQNLAAMMNVDLTKFDPKTLRFHFDAQKETVKKIREFLDTGKTEFVLNYMNLRAVPPHIGQLVNLTLIQMQWNEISALPSEIGELKNLEFIDLSFNKLTFLPDEIGELVNLKKLHLWRNMLTTLPTNIGKLAKLTHLILGANMLTVLPVEMCNLVNLQDLNFDSNPLTALPVELAKLTKLRTLTLMCCPFIRNEAYMTLLDTLSRKEVKCTIY